MPGGAPQAHGVCCVRLPLAAACRRRPWDVVRAQSWVFDERSVEERGNDAPSPPPIDAFAALALARGTFLGRPCAPSKRASEDLERNEPRLSARHKLQGSV